MENVHRWSGWPGAYCLKCGAEDPIEIAMADGDYDAAKDKWVTEEKRLEVMRRLICPVKE